MNHVGDISTQAKQEESQFSYIQFRKETNFVVCTLRGTWSIDNNSGSDVRKEWEVFFYKNPTIQVFEFQLDAQIKWDSTLVSFLHKCRNDLKVVNKSIKFDELPSGLSQLLELSEPTLLEKKQNEFSLSLELIDDTINYFRNVTLSLIADVPNFIAAFFILGIIGLL